MGDDRESAGEAPRRSSFAGRWLKRLIVLAVIVLLVLGYGFYKMPGPDGVPQKKYPWDDWAGFKTYASDTGAWLRAEGAKLLAGKKEGAEVAPAAETAWSARAEELHAKAVAIVGTGGPEAAPAPAPAAEPRPRHAPPLRTPKGTTEAITSAEKQSTDGNLDRLLEKDREAEEAAAAEIEESARSEAEKAYEVAFAVYREGLVHFRDAKPGRSQDRLAELKAARAAFGEARDRLEKAKELPGSDARIGELAKDVSLFSEECDTQLKAAAF